MSALYGASLRDGNLALIVPLCLPTFAASPVVSPPWFVSPCVGVRGGAWQGAGLGLPLLLSHPAGKHLATLARLLVCVFVLVSFQFLLETIRAGGRVRTLAKHHTNMKITNDNIEDIRAMMGPDFTTTDARSFAAQLLRDGIIDTDELTFEEWVALLPKL